MIERFFSKTYKDVGTSDVVVYTGPEDMNTAFVTGLFVSNTTDRNTWFEVRLYQKKSDVTTIITSAETPIPAGSTAAVAALGQRMQLTPGDKLSIRCGLDKATDVMISVSEVIYSKDELNQMQQTIEENLKEEEKEDHTFDGKVPI